MVKISEEKKWFFEFSPHYTEESRKFSLRHGYLSVSFAELSMGIPAFRIIVPETCLLPRQNSRCLIPQALPTMLSLVSMTLRLQSRWKTRLLPFSFIVRCSSLFSCPFLQWPMMASPWGQSVQPARGEARRIIDDDPACDKAENALLWQHLDSLRKTQTNWGAIS